MKSKKTKLFLTMLICFYITIANAQIATSASGGDAYGNGGSAAYTIGQVTYTTNTETTSSLAQGVQQAYEISIISELDNLDINLNLSIYPNPTTDLLTLNIDALNNENIAYQLFDINGKILVYKKITTNQESILMADYASATYFLKITKNNKEVQTFKIIKTK